MPCPGLYLVQELVHILTSCTGAQGSLAPVQIFLCLPRYSAFCHELIDHSWKHAPAHAICDMDETCPLRSIPVLDVSVSVSDVLPDLPEGSGLYLIWLGEKIPIAGCTGEPLCAGCLVGGVHGAATGSATTAAGRLNVLAAAGLLNVLAAAGLLITGAGGFACILAKLDASVWVTETSGHRATRKP